jgi:hypothetical protein
MTEGVVRCYMASDRCAGFGHQKVKALVDTPAARAEAEYFEDGCVIDQPFQVRL